MEVATTFSRVANRGTGLLEPSVRILLEQIEDGGIIQRLLLRVLPRRRRHRLHRILTPLHPHHVLLLLRGLEVKFKDVHLFIAREVHYTFEVKDVVVMV